MTFEKMLARQNPSMDASAIREILKVLSRPGMISLAGGIPSPDAFPMDILPTLIDNVLSKYAHRAFQYDLSEGFTPLREALVDYLKDQIGINVTMGSILIGSGSQGILDGIGKILISKGDIVAMEAPTYLGAIQAFNPYEPTYCQLETDEDGLIPDSLERVLKKGGVKFIYLVPTFQNPTGRTLPLNRRIQIAHLIQKYHALLVEDDPYSALRYHGEPVQTIHSLAPENVVYLGTLSKVFAPGLRIGFCVAPDAVRKYLIIAKQGVDLHTATLSQALSAEYITGGFLNRQLPRILAHYAPRQQAMLTALDDYFPTGFKWSRPDGGMFIWLQGDRGTDMEKIYHQAIKKNVAFVPGKYFFTRKGAGIETARLNYTMADTATITRAISILADVIKAEVAGG
jgi:2-aminoadipate transaminase